MSASTAAADTRMRAIRFVLWAILFANWAVAGAKFAFGLIIESTAMTADGLHSFIDGGSNVIGLIALHFAHQPADDEHPYGHQKFEALAALAIGVMIGMTVIELGRMAFNAIVRDVHPQVTMASFVVMVTTLLINVFVTQIEKRQGEKLKSTLLLADAKHTLTDIFVTLSVIASLGLSWAGVGRVDGVVALVVLIFVSKAGWDIIKQSAGILADTARVDPRKVSEVCAQIREVLAVRDVRSRGMEGSVYVDLKIDVAPELTLHQAHAISEAVEQAIASTFPEVVDVVVHVEPARADSDDRARLVR